jgi:hypothetical protein
VHDGRRCSRDDGSLGGRGCLRQVLQEVDWHIVCFEYFREDDGPVGLGMIGLAAVNQESAEDDRQNVCPVYPVA